MIIKIIEDFDFAYGLSQEGKIFKFTGEKNKELKIYDNGSGYKITSLKKDGKYKMYYVHRLVAKYFIQNTNNHLEVNHIDFDKSNNNYLNLEWCSRQENMNHFKNNSLFDYTTRKYNSKFTLNKKDKTGIWCIDLFKSTNKYRLRIYIKDKRKHYGYFSTYNEALDKKNSLKLY